MQVQPAQVVPLDHKDLQEQQVQEPLVQVAQTALMEPQVRQDLMVLLDHKDHKDLPEQQDSRVQPDHKDLLEQQVQEPQVQVAHKGLLEQQVQEPQVQVVSTALMVQPVQVG